LAGALEPDPELESELEPLSEDETDFDGDGSEDVDDFVSLGEPESDEPESLFEEVDAAALRLSVL
jgi:hypothetical protein